MRIYRVIFVLALLSIVYFGGRYYFSSQEENRLREYKKYASLISEISLAVEIYRNEPDSFLIARDSIMNHYGLTIDSIDAFRARLSEDNKEWAKVWEIVQTVTDSLVDENISRYNTDTVATVSDSSASSNIQINTDTSISDSL